MMKTLKRLAILTIMLISLVVVLTVAASAETVASGTCGTSLTWTLDDTGTLTISGTGYMDRYDYVNAPWYSSRSSVRNVIINNDVLSIGKYAFSECTNLMSIEIPESVTQIADYAFNRCTGLVNISIPESVTTIGYNAFYYCSSLESVTIPNGVTKINDWAFSNCTNLTNVEIGNGVTSIGKYAFQSTGLLSVTIPDSVTKIGDYAFLGSALESIRIPGSVTDIGNNAFQRCNSLTDVYITDSSAWCQISFKSSYSNPAYPDGKIHILDSNGQEVSEVVLDDTVTVIPDFAFNNCQSLQSIKLPDAVKGIGFAAFANCVNLSAINVPDGVTIVDGRAFDNCQSLCGVTIPDSVTSIGYRAFFSCTDLTSVKIPGSVNTIGEQAFSGTFLQNVYITNPSAWCNTKFEGSDSNPLSVFGSPCLHVLDEEGKEVTDVVLDNTVTAIPNDAFYNCINLQSITISDNVITIGDSAFCYCKNLTGVTIPDSVTSIGKAAFDKCTLLEKVRIGSNVTTIGGAAFRDCISLTSITIPKSVTNIGTQAFYGCTYIGDVYITDPSAWCNIIFEGSHSNPMYGTDTSLHVLDAEGRQVTDIVLDSTVTAVPSYAFRNCKNLQNITIPENVTSLGSYVFSGCTDLISITIPDGVTRIGESMFYNCTSLESITIPDSVISIGQSAFNGCESLNSVTIPDGVTNIGWGAFTDCINLLSIEIPDSVTYISDYAFYRCSSLTSFTIPDGVSSIGKFVFAGCDDLSSITIPDSVTSIGKSAFESCVSLTSIIIPDNVTSIGSSAFNHCNSLTSITIPESITTVSNNAFGSCDNLSTVFYRGTLEQKNSIVINNYNSYLVNAAWHYEVKDVTYLGRDCYYCNNCGKYFLKGAASFEYTVIFADEDGTELSKCTCYWGDVVEPPDDPVKASDNTYFYTFAGWDKEVVNCTGDAAYTATYTSDYIDYTVIFANDDGTELSKNTYHWGDKVTVPETPEKLTDNPYAYTYAFVGWDKAVTDCTGNVTYTATYKPIYIDYTVIFLNEDGAELSKNTYHWGDTVVAPEVPEKLGDNTYTYAFAGWDKEVVSCAGDATYTATYTPAYIDYTVVFRNWDETEISSTSYHWGDTVEVPECPVRPNDKNYAYTFAGWDQEITACDGNKVYTATYKSWKFADVNTNTWQIAPITYVFDRGLMAGKGTDKNGNIKFDPNSPITREEFVQVLYNAEGKPSVNFVYNFLDVVKNAWYENAVLWAKKNDIANGTPDGNFGVGKNISRQDLALMLYKYAKLKGCSLEAEDGRIDQFADGDKVADYAKNAMNWAVTNGILSGKGTAGADISTFYLDPAGTATRAECAAMLKNFMTAFGL